MGRLNKAIFIVLMLFFGIVGLSLLGIIAGRTSQEKPSKQGEVKSHQEVKEDTEIAKLQKAAEDGHILAQLELAGRYHYGIEVPIDKSKGVFWWRKAAEQGSDQAQRRLGSIYRDGDGVSMDKSEAVNWWRRAAAQGNSDAYLALGLASKNGHGIANDNIEAYKWFYLGHLSWPKGAIGDWFVPELRDLSEVMTASQIDEAKRRAYEQRVPPKK